MAAPHPKPVELKILQGNPGQRRLPQTPRFAPLTDHPPEWLEPEAKAEWRRLAVEFDRVGGLVRRPDRAAMISLCSEWATYVAAVKERAETQESRAKQRAHQRARESLTLLLRLWSVFGMTPADRARIDLSRGDDKSAFTEFFDAAGQSPGR